MEQDIIFIGLGKKDKTVITITQKQKNRHLL